MSDQGVPKGAELQESAAASLGVEAGAPGILFQGCNSVTGEVKSRVVSGTRSSGGAASAVHCEVCTDLETLAKTLEIKGSLSASYGPIGSATVKTEFVRSLQISTYSVSIIVYAQHVTGTEQVTSVKLDRGKDAPTDRQSRAEFFSSYGDSFIWSRTLGGEYFAVYVFHSHTKEERTQLVAEMEAKGLFKGVTVGASLQTAITEVRNSTKTHWTLRQKVTGIKDPPNLPSEAGIIEFALKFPSLEVDAPTVISFETRGYEIVPEFKNSFGDIPDNRAFFVGTDRRPGLTKDLARVLELQAQIKWLQSIYGFYDYRGDAKLKTAGDDATSDLYAIDKLIEKWSKAPESEFSRPALETDNLGMPSLNYTIKYTKASRSGTGGGPFNHVDESTYLQSKTRIESVQLRYGDLIDRLMVTYVDGTGKRTTKTDGDSEGAHDSPKLTLREGQFIGTITGTSSGSGQVMSWLKFIGGGSEIMGGHWADDDNKHRRFDWEFFPNNDKLLLGFAGRKGKFIDQLQAVYAIFEPATWAKDA